MNNQGICVYGDGLIHIYWNGHQIFNVWVKDLHCTHFKLKGIVTHSQAVKAAKQYIYTSK